MRHNTLTRRAAALLIRKARRLGMTVKVSTTRDSTWRYTQVSLSGSYHKGALYVHCHVLLGFTKHKGHAWRVSVETSADYFKGYRRGAFDAQYIVNDYFSKYVCGQEVLR